jgi:hypothetical protein
MFNVFPYVNLFTSTITDLLRASMLHPPLRHGVLAISALFADKNAQLGRARAYEHHQKSIRLLQTALSAVEVNEGIVISILLLTYFNVASGEHAAARKHLLGLRVVFENLQMDIRKKGRLTPYAIGPLTMLTWRTAIRMDFILAMIYSLPPIFPM